MSNDLDLRGIDQRHELDPQFRAALQHRLASIVAGTDPGSVTEDTRPGNDRPRTHDRAHRAESQPPPGRQGRPGRRRRRGRNRASWRPARRRDASRPTVTDRDVPPTTPPRALPTRRRCSCLGRTSSRRSTEHRRRGSSSPSAAGGGAVTAASSTGDRQRGRRHGDVRPTRCRVLRRLPPERWVSPGAVTTLDGLVAALSEQQGWADVTAPSDISIDGYVGKAFQRTAPAGMSRLRINERLGARESGDGRVSRLPKLGKPTRERGGGVYYEPGEIETLWVLDIDGTVVVISTGVWPEPSAADRRRVRRRRARLDPHRPRLRRRLACQASTRSVPK